MCRPASRLPFRPLSKFESFMTNDSPASGVRPSDQTPDDGGHPLLRRAASTLRLHNVRRANNERRRPTANKTGA